MRYKTQRQRQPQPRTQSSVLPWLMCTLLGGDDGGGPWNSSHNSSHNGRYAGKAFALADITATTTTAQPSRHLASFSLHNHPHRKRRGSSSSSNSDDDPPPSFWTDMNSWELFSWNPSSLTDTTTTTRTTTTTPTTRSGLSVYEKHIDASQYVGGKNGTLVWTDDHLLVFVVSDDDENEEEESTEAAPSPPAAPTTTEAPSVAATPNRPMEDMTNNDTPQQDDEEAVIVLDCSRYENWESPPLPCQDEEDEDEDEDTDDDRPSQEEPPIENGMEEEEEATARNLISLRMIVGMQDPPKTMDYIQHVTSMVTNQLVQEKTPFDAFYFGMPQTHNSDDTNGDDDGDVGRRRSLITTTNTSGDTQRRRQLETADSSSSSSTSSTRQVHLLHAWTTMTPYEYFEVPQDGGKKKKNNKTNNETLDNRYLRSNPSSTTSRRLQPPPMIDDVVWYETHIEYAALFAYPDGTTQPIQNREYLGNITSYCQWHLDRNIENGKWVKELDWTIYDWIYNLTTTTTATTATMNDTMLEEMTEDLDFVAAAVMPTSSGIVLDPYWVAELRGRPRTIPTQALVLRFEWREWLGLAMGTLALLFALFFHVAASFLQRKHQEQQWKATLTEQGIGDVLKVGWRYQVTTAVPTASRAAAAAAATTPQDHPQIFLQVYENPKRHFRNEDDSSLLRGGVEQEEMGRTRGASAFVLPPNVAPTQSMSSTSASLQDDSSTTPRTRNGMTSESSKLSYQVPSKQAKKTQNDVKSVASLPASASKRSFQDAEKSRKKKVSSNFHPIPPHARNPQCADWTSNGSSSGSLLSSGATRLSVDPSGQLHRPPRSHIPSRKGRPCASDLMSSSSTTMTALSLPVTTKTKVKNTKSHDNKSSHRQPKGLVTKTTPPK